MKLIVNYQTVLGKAGTCGAGLFISSAKVVQTVFDRVFSANRNLLLLVPVFMLQFRESDDRCLQVVIFSIYQTVGQMPDSANPLLGVNATKERVNGLT